MGDLMVSGDTLYGTTQRGGSTGGGTLFSLALPRPGITRIRVNGGNIMLNATNGVPGENYILSASSDVRLPVAQWTPIATNAPDLGGNLTFNATDTVVPAPVQRFYILQIE